MVVPPSTGANTAHQQQPQPSATRSSTRASNSNHYHQSYNANVPLSARRAAPLDLSTVERRGHPTASREPVKRVRPHGLQEAPTFRPTEDEFKDPFEYIRKIAPEGKKYGICKIVPPDNWTPPFAIDTEVRYPTISRPLLPVMHVLLFLDMADILNFCFLFLAIPLSHPPAGVELG